MCGDILKFSPNLEWLHQHHAEVIIVQFQFVPFWQRNAVLSIQLTAGRKSNYIILYRSDWLISACAYRSQR